MRSSENFQTTFLNGLKNQEGNIHPLQTRKQTADFADGKLSFQAAFRSFRSAAEAADVGDAAEVGVLDAQFSGEEGFGHSGHTQYVHAVAAVTLDFGAGRPARALQAAVNGLGV